MPLLWLKDQTLPKRSGGCRRISYVLHIIVQSLVAALHTIKSACEIHYVRYWARPPTTNHGFTTDTPAVKLQAFPKLSSASFALQHCSLIFRSNKTTVRISIFAFLYWRINLLSSWLHLQGKGKLKIIFVGPPRAKGILFRAYPTR